MHRLALALVPVIALSGTAIAATAPSHFHAVGIRASYTAPKGPTARRMTEALNILEAKGYGDFKDFHAKGGSFTATVTKNGKAFAVTIDPQSDTVTTQS